MCVGGFFTCAITAEARVKCWGDGTDGRTGMERTDFVGDEVFEMGDFLPLINLGSPQPEVTSLACSDKLACALLSTGTVRCWGQKGANGGTGQYEFEASSGNALGTMGVMLPPTQLPSGRSATSISCGSEHCCVVLDDGNAFCWGKNDQGQLGDGGYNLEFLGTRNAGGDVVYDGRKLTPDDFSSVDLPPGRTVLKIACGKVHTCCILDDESVVCWGGNDQGIVGNGRNSASVCKEWNDGTCGANLVPVNLGYGRVAVDIATGADWSCAVLDNGGVHCWGYNGFSWLGVDSLKFVGNIGDSPLEPGGIVEPITFQGGKAVKIFGLAQSRCVILDVGDVVCWGKSTNGQLGIGTEGTLSALWERTEYPTVDLGGRKAFALAVGGGTDNTGYLVAHQCAMLSAADCEECEDEIKCWGYNGQGQLGYGDKRARGLTRGDFVNDVVDLGSPGVHPAFELGGYDRAPEPTQPDVINSLAIGNYHTCAILAMGRVVCWGNHQYGQLGTLATANAHVGRAVGSISKATPVFFGYDASKRPEMGTFFAKKIIGGYVSSCAILEDDSLTCWGSSYFAQIGFGPLNVARGSDIDDDNGLIERVPVLDSAGVPAKIVDVCGGQHFKCAATSEGTTWCWGQDSYGQLGLGTNTKVTTYPTPVDLGADEITGAPLRTVALTCGEHTVCAVFDDGRAKCWGRNYYGQLGYGTGTFSDDFNVGGAAGEMGDALPFLRIGEGRRVMKMSAGVSHFCAILDTHRLKCWGRNFAGVLGLNRNDVAVTLANEHGTPHDERETIVDFGDDAFCRPLRVVDVASMMYSSCALFETGQVKCWGQNDAHSVGGQLGLGVPRTDAGGAFGDAAGEVGNNLPFLDLGTGWRVKRLATSDYGAIHMCVVLAPDGNDPDMVSEGEPEKIKCWGANDSGQLGIETSDASRGTSRLQMGDNLPAVNFKSVARLAKTGWALAVSPELSYPEQHAEWQTSNVTVPVIENAWIGNWSDDLELETLSTHHYSNGFFFPPSVEVDGSGKKTAGNASYPLPGWAVGAPGTIRTWQAYSWGNDVITDVFTTSEPVVVRALVESGYENRLNWGLQQFSARSDLNFDAYWTDGARVDVYERLYPAGTHEFEIDGFAYFLFFAQDPATLACREQQPADLLRAAIANTTYASFSEAATSNAPGMTSLSPKKAVPWRVESDSPLLWSGARPLPDWSEGALGLTFDAYDDSKTTVTFFASEPVVVRLIDMSNLEVTEFGNWTRRPDLDWNRTGLFQVVKNQVYERFFDAGWHALDARTSYRVSENFWYQFFADENTSLPGSSTTAASAPPVTYYPNTYQANLQITNGK